MSTTHRKSKNHERVIFWGVSHTNYPLCFQVLGVQYLLHIILRIRIILKSHRILKIKFAVRSYNMNLENFVDLQTYKQN